MRDPASYRFPWWQRKRESVCIVTFAPSRSESEYLAPPLRSWDDAVAVALAFMDRKGFRNEGSGEELTQPEERSGGGWFGRRLVWTRDDETVTIDELYVMPYVTDPFAPFDTYGPAPRWIGPNPK